MTGNVIHVVNRATRKGVNVALLRVPFFSPLSPPLGLGMLKACLQQNGHRATCFDFNVDSVLWETQKKYFSCVEASEGSSSKDGYSKLWALINAHMHAFLAGASRDACIRVVRTIAALYGLSLGGSVAGELHDLVELYFRRLVICLDALDLARLDYVGVSTYTT